MTNGDKLETRMYDSSWNLYYKKKINMLDIKQWKELIADLKSKGGVDFIEVKKTKKWW